VTCIETSVRETGQGAVSVEGGEETVPHCSKSATELKTSRWEARQGAILIESVEEVVFYGSDVTRVEASAWQASESTIPVEVLEEETSRICCTYPKVSRQLW